LQLAIFYFKDYVFFSFCIYHCRTTRGRRDVIISEILYTKNLLHRGKYDINETPNVASMSSVLEVG